MPIAQILSPLGPVTVMADGQGITGLWFGACSGGRDDLPLFDQVRKWLDAYFAGKNPQMDLPVHLAGTPFQMEVWEILKGIPYGKTMTYGEIAHILAQRRGLAQMSAQAVGQAVAKNPVSLLVPCHRVVGKNGNLVGYAGGLKKKEYLLKLEKM